MNDDQSLESGFWTVLGRDVNIGERCFPTLAFVWISCLITFSVAALILARQNFKTYKQQEELENQRKEMTNSLAHDLKTPLSIISGYAQNLQENVHTEKREHYANHIQANVDRMDKIIHQMLELTRLESDSLQTEFEDVALGELCKKIIDRYKPVWEEKLITASLDGEAVIKADHSLMLRVIDNFFVNALDNTPAGGKISIRILNDTLEVYNSGSYIAEDKIDEIWLPFKKGDVSRSQTKGTGLGLAIARAILELHNCSYGAVNSENGVIFWFRFR
ncbi:MAG: sensor histidine kinase [Bacillota bacterium]